MKTSGNGQKCYNIKVTPQKFLRLSTDELADIGRKLDKGNELLGEITRNTSELTKNTSELPEIKNGIENLNTKFDSFLAQQTDHNKHLEKILEKLTEVNK